MHGWLTAEQESGCVAKEHEAAEAEEAAAATRIAVRFIIDVPLGRECVETGRRQGVHLCRDGADGQRG